MPKKIQLILKWKSFDPGQVGHDNFHSITGGMNYYIHGDDLKLMADYVHTPGQTSAIAIRCSALMNSTTFFRVQARPKRFLSDNRS